MVVVCFSVFFLREVVLRGFGGRAFNYGVDMRERERGGFVTVTGSAIGIVYFGVGIGLNG